MILKKMNRFLRNCLIVICITIIAVFLLPIEVLKSIIRFGKDTIEFIEESING